MKTIYKYEIPAHQSIINFELPLPIGRRFPAFDRQDRSLQVWYLIDTAADIERAKFLIVGTGWHLEAFCEDVADWTYRGTGVMPNGYVWHLFEGAAHPAAGPGAGTAQSKIRNSCFAEQHPKSNDECPSGACGQMKTTTEATEALDAPTKRSSQRFDFDIREHLSRPGGVKEGRAWPKPKVGVHGQRPAASTARRRREGVSNAE